jgi:hypothetical protein
MTGKVRLLLVAVLATALAVPLGLAPPTAPVGPLEPLTAAPAAAHESSSGIACSIESTVALHITPANNVYEATSVTCTGHYNTIPDCCWTVEGIARIRCYRNGQPWDGCRGNGNIESQWRLESSSTWNVGRSWGYAVPAGVGWPCSGASCWFSVSERFESDHDLDNNQSYHRGKNEGTSIRFRLADGGNVVKSATDQWGDACLCYN